MKQFSHRSCQTILICVFLLLILSSCTENPLTGNASGVRSHRTISGQIAFDLADSTQTPRAYIWLEALNMGTYSEADGRFQLNIPAPVHQPGGGYTGSSSLYFFLANFTMDSVRVVFNKGDLIFNQGGLNELGSISREIVLKQLLSVQTAMVPNFFATDFEDTLRVSVSLTVTTDSLRVWTYSKKQGDIDGLIAIRLDSLNTRVYVLKNAGGREVARTLWASEEWNGEFFIARHSLPAGEYRVHPYVWPEAVRPPLKLLNQLGVRAYSLDEDFINLPFLRSGGRLTITEPK